VSILMPVHNAAAFLDAAIGSILSQTFADFELLIIDDSSTDETMSIAQRYDDRRIRLESAPGRGVATVLNLGLDIAKAPYVARMDGDDISHPERIAKQIAVLDRNPDLVLLGSNYNVIDVHGRRTGRTRVFTHPDDVKIALVISNQFGHGSVMLRGAAVKRLGGYDADAFGAAAEDYDLWVRLSHIGRVANLAEPLYAWRVNPRGVTQTRSVEVQAATSYIRKREFERLCEKRSEYRIYSSFHPDRPGYCADKAYVLRKLAAAYRRVGKPSSAAAAIAAAAAIHPPTLAWLARSVRSRMRTTVSDANIAAAHGHISPGEIIAGLRATRPAAVGHRHSLPPPPRTEPLLPR
jgi:glycosyltransferase involved in cell wall biosynthesis